MPIYSIYLFNLHKSQSISPLLVINSFVSLMLRFLSQELIGEESMDEQSMMNPQDSVREIDATIKPPQGVKVIQYHLIVHTRLKINIML